MERVRIGITKEVAVIIEQVKPKAGTYVAKKVVMGKYNNQANIFVDEDGNVYLHFSEYDPNNKKSKYFIGKIPITVFTEAVIKLSKEQFLNDYLKRFQCFTFQQRVDKIICTNALTNKKCYFEDDITLFNSELRKCLEEAMTEFTNSVVEQLNKGEAENTEEDNIVDFPKEKEYKVVSSQSIISKKINEIEKEMQKYIKGQDEAIKEILTSIYEYLKFSSGEKTNMLIIGPTGVGKTYIFEVISKLFNIPLLVYSVPGLTQSGYVGKSVDEIITQLISTCGGDVKKAERSIVLLDEIDKIASTSRDEGRVATEGVQNELLKMIDGEKILVKLPGSNEKIEFDTSKILFIGAGAFQEIFNKKEEPVKKVGFGSEKEIKPQKIVKIDELVKYGIKRELTGRMPQIIELKPLTEEDLLDIILNKKDSKMRKAEELLYNECGIVIANLDEVASILAKDAISKNIGARGINSTITKMFKNIKYDVFNSIGLYNTLTIGKNILEDPNDYTLSVKEKTNTPKKLIRKNGEK